MPGPNEYFAAEKSRIEQALKDKRPVILIIPKIADHLAALASTLKTTLEPFAAQHDGPIHMAIFDDEADDASVLDASQNKLIPRRIEQLWSGSFHGTTRHPNIFATYIAYTATPQANFLQYANNPLAPDDFCLALRTPYKSGTTAATERTTTFTEPEGIKRYYTGGDFFYREFPSEGLGRICWTKTFPQRNHFEHDDDWYAAVRKTNDEMLYDGLRAYLVAAAIRLDEHMAKGGFGYTNFESDSLLEEEVATKLPKPQSMLVHPTVQTSGHFEERRRILLWANGYEPDSKTLSRGVRYAAEEGSLELRAAGIRARIEQEEDAWKSWYRSYHDSLDRLSDVPGTGFLKAHAIASWTTIKETLINEVVPAVSLKVINSDEDADERPTFEFKPDPSEPSYGYPPKDLLTIFVAGNVLARGVTIEGLTTTVFSRSTSTPSADTQMQMQRWFGYRGGFAHLPRLFTYDDQLRLFEDYHDHDVLVRTEILKNMDLTAGGLSPTALIHGSNSWATRKVSTRRVAMHPGPHPSIRLLNPHHGNQHVLEGLLETMGDKLRELPTQQDKGYIFDHLFSLHDIANLLDRFVYDDHDPRPVRPEEVGKVADDAFALWATLHKRYNFPKGTQFFRPNRSSNEASGLRAVEPDGCPYMIAAYLRFWDLALNQANLRGLFPKYAPRLTWEIEREALKAPYFYVGIRNGSLDEWNAQSQIRQVRRDLQDNDKHTLIKTLWGGSQAKDSTGAYYGDQFFDYHLSNFDPPEQPEGDQSRWRPKGDPGLLLFHVIGASSPGGSPMVTVGLSLPKDGPDQIAALR